MESEDTPGLFGNSIVPADGAHIRDRLSEHPRIFLPFLLKRTRFSESPSRSGPAIIASPDSPFAIELNHGRTCFPGTAAASALNTLAAHRI